MQGLGFGLHGLRDVGFGVSCYKKETLLFAVCPCYPHQQPSLGVEIYLQELTPCRKVKIHNDWVRNRVLRLGFAY